MTERDLAERIRAHLGPAPELREQRMFGGIAFLVVDTLAVAVMRDGALLVRVAPDEVPGLVAAGEADRMVMGRRTMRGWVRVDVERLDADGRLARWVDRGVTYALSLASDGAAGR